MVERRGKGGRKMTTRIMKMNDEDDVDNHHHVGGGGDKTSRGKKIPTSVELDELG
jgi:hypothetical protein